ncbi:MAG: hypothetical protein AAFS10_04405, partial [Myxococcota bacterium]
YVGATCNDLLTSCNADHIAQELACHHACSALIDCGGYSNDTSPLESCVSDCTSSPEEPSQLPYDFACIEALDEPLSCTLLESCSATQPQPGSCEALCDLVIAVDMEARCGSPYRAIDMGGLGRMRCIDDCNSDLLIYDRICLENQLEANRSCSTLNSCPNVP